MNFTGPVHRLGSGPGALQSPCLPGIGLQGSHITPAQPLHASIGPASSYMPKLVYRGTACGALHGIHGEPLRLDYMMPGARSGLQTKRLNTPAVRYGEVIKLIHKANMKVALAWSIGCNWKLGGEGESNAYRIFFSNYGFQTGVDPRFPERGCGSSLCGWLHPLIPASSATDHTVRASGEFLKS